jgi:4-amino-4-deoxy-L-arabinose transferase-like glycosyltransferase
MGGPGDQLSYYEQAAKLFPFTHTAYGPVYFVVIRLVHDWLGLDWFLAGKITSWVSAGVFLALCFYLFKHILGREICWLALALVAINPTFIGESYDALTIMFGASLALAGIVLTLRALPDRTLDWVLPGLVFGFAYLTRFQALGLLLGAVIGTFLIPSARSPNKFKSALVLLLSAAFPVLVWNGLLLWQQGYVPKNNNFMHLALGLGETFNWKDKSNLEKYGSLWGVLSSHWSAPFRIGMYAVKETIKFPFTLGYELLFVAAGWLVPGAIIAVLRRDQHGPWLVAFALGLILTGIGSLGWLHYYVVFLPFAVILIVFAIQSLSVSGLRGLSSLSWMVIFVGSVIWSPYMVRSRFLDTHWPEFTIARDYVETHRDSNTIVSTTAAGFRYGTTVPFVDLDDILRPGESKELVLRLWQHGITFLIITERHTLYNFPDLKYLLADEVDSPPAGLRRELLIKDPRRLAIYRVLPH